MYTVLTRVLLRFRCGKYKKMYQFVKSLIVHLINMVIENIQQEPVSTYTDSYENSYNKLNL